MCTTEFIDGFSDPSFRFLSNFYSATIVHGGYTWPSSEHMYQAYKTLNLDERIPFLTCTAGQAKRKGRKVTMRDDWDLVKDDVMELVVTLKFTQNEYLKDMLIATGDLYIQETNTWNDTYWGVCNEIGQNKLGFILMEIRQQLLDNR